MTSKMKKQVLIVAIGLILRGLGVGFMIVANLGANPATVFQLGFSVLSNIPYGTAAALANLIILFLVYRYNKSYVHLASIMAIVLIGYSADLVTLILPASLTLTYSLTLRYVYLLLGCAVLSFGTALYIQADLGVGALDVIAEIITDRTHIDYQTVRILSDSMFLFLGYIMGGNIGVGTTVSLILTGVMMQYFKPYTTRFVNGLLSKQS